jgi:hypothetical protein
MEITRNRLGKWIVQFSIMLLLLHFWVNLSMTKSLKISILTIIVLGTIDMMGRSCKRKVH